MKPDILKIETDRVITTQFDYEDVRRRLNFSELVKNRAPASKNTTPWKKILAVSLPCAAAAAVIIPVAVYMNRIPTNPDYIPGNPDNIPGNEENYSYIFKSFVIKDENGNDGGIFKFYDAYYDGDYAVFTLMLNQINGVSDVYFCDNNAQNIQTRYNVITALKPDSPDSEGLYYFDFSNYNELIYIDFIYSKDYLNDVFVKDYNFSYEYIDEPSCSIESSSLSQNTHTENAYLFNVMYGVSPDRMQPMEFHVPQTYMDEIRSVDYTANSMQEALTSLGINSTLMLNGYGLEEQLTDKIRCFSNGNYTSLNYSYGINNNIQIERFINFPHTFENQDIYDTFSDYLMSKSGYPLEYTSEHTVVAIDENYTADLYTYVKSGDGILMQIAVITPNEGTNEYYIMRIELYDGNAQFNPDVIDTEELIKNMTFYTKA